MLNYFSRELLGLWKSFTFVISRVQSKKKKKKKIKIDYFT